MSETGPKFHILVVEDEYILAMDLRRGLIKQGFDVVGPAGSVKDALALINSNTIDAAVLDVSLSGETVIPVAELLSARGIPFVFATGYDTSDLPQKWRSVRKYEKPADAVVLSQALRTIIVG